MKNFLFLFCIVVLSFDTSGQDIKKVKISELEKTINDSDKPLVINFWATFCAPCIKEIPYFQEEIAGYSKDSVSLLLVSLDLKDFYPAKISSFAKAKNFTAPIIWLDETNADHFCPKIDSSWSGAIPATLFINNRTGFRRFLEKEISREELKGILKSMTAK
jgi:thiol-disulfide isomerase/thioredoxin